MRFTLLSLVLIGVAVAIPHEARADAAATTCSPTSTAKFDTLSTGTAPPANYGKALWSGWTVQKASSYNLTAPSSANIIFSPPITNQIASSISQESSTVANFTLKSFYLGCTMPGPQGGIVPANCSIVIDAETRFGAGGYPVFVQYGPYNYTVAKGAKVPGLMTKVTLPSDALGFTYYFTFPGADPNKLPGLYLDDVVVVNPAAC